MVKNLDVTNLEIFTHYVSLARISLLNDCGADQTNKRVDIVPVRLSLGSDS